MIAQDLRACRARFKSARHALAAAVVAGTASRDAAWTVLRALDTLREITERPSPRDARAWRRWRRFALAAIRDDPPSPALLSRAHRMNTNGDNL